MNKLKEQMNEEIKIAVAKYNSSVFILNGGTAKESKKLYGFAIPIVSLRRFCNRANPEAYTSIATQEKYLVKWDYEGEEQQYHSYLVDISDLRESKHLFIGN